MDAVTNKERKKRDETQKKTNTNTMHLFAGGGNAAVAE